MAADEELELDDELLLELEDVLAAVAAVLAKLAVAGALHVICFLRAKESGS